MRRAGRLEEGLADAKRLDRAATELGADLAPHPVHGRIQQWTLTPRGATLLKACRDRVIALEKRIARNLDSKAETTVRRWLAGIAADLQDD
ncbi:transcriptional regulatory protein [Bradyrhizobium diazoefficiens]|uniref:Transcriptional regulatory protein n=1 Tax=Bradyrhizobium diazoefficiens TaxID=1355477 RepID=A0A0E4BV52_9BRAD|nr:transcriptional regulatory protein [Bradyrhizobium diazoefficiens]